MLTAKRRSSEKAGDGLLTRRQLAVALGVRIPTVRKWDDDGCPVAERGGPGVSHRYEIGAVKAWRAARQEANGATPTHVSLTVERARKERAQAIEAEQRTAIRAKQLVPVDDVVRAQAAEVARVRTKLLALPLVLSDRLHRAAMLRGVAGVEGELRAAVDDVLRELARPEAEA